MDIDMTTAWYNVTSPAPVQNTSPPPAVPALPAAPASEFIGTASPIASPPKYANTMETSSSSTPIIIGAVVGGTAALAAGVVLALNICRKRKVSTHCH